MRSADVIERMRQGTVSMDDVRQLHPLGVLKLWEHYDLWPVSLAQELGEAVVNARKSLGRDPGLVMTGAEVYTQRQEDAVTHAASLLNIPVSRWEERALGRVPPPNTIGTFLLRAGADEEYSDRGLPEEFITTNQIVGILKNGLSNVVAGLVVEDLGNVTNIRNGHTVRAIRVRGFSEP